TATATDEIEAGKINYAFEVTLLAKSVSRQDILLMGFQVDLTSANYGRTQYTNIDDRFFSLNAIKEGQVETLNRTLGPVSSSAANTELRSTSPTAEARVVFVQFLDGSIWGDTERAQAALDQRRATVNELERLLVVF